jgi:hypothetical protein
MSMEQAGCSNKLNRCKLEVQVASGKEVGSEDWKPDQNRDRAGQGLEGGQNGIRKCMVVTILPCPTP